MKKNLFFLALTAIVAFCACNPKDEKKVYDPAYFSCFGFKAEDNPSVISQDYIIENPASGKLSFAFPAGASAEGIKALKVSFELSEAKDEDSVPVVKVDGSEVKDGDVFDFSSPVDFYVSVGNVNTLYSVSVKIKDAPSWKSIAQSEEDVYNSNPGMAINPVDGYPYFAARVDNHVFAFKTTSSSIESLTKDQLDDVEADNPFISCDPDGVPYVIFDDKKTGTSATTKKVSVVKIENGAVSFVGPQSALYASENGSFALFPFSSDNVWAAFGAGRNGGTRRNLTLAHYSASAWELDQKAGENSDKRAYYVRSAIKGDKAYLLCFNNLTSGANVFDIYKYENSTWGDFGSVALISTSKEDIGTIYLTNMDIDADDQGNVYILATADYDGGGYKLAVTRVSPDGVRTLIGSPVPAYIHTTTSANIAVGPDGTPYIVYVANGDYDIAVRYIEPSSRDWSDEVILPAASGEAQVRLAGIAFNADGKAFVGLKNKADKLEVLAAE